DPDRPGRDALPLICTARHQARTRLEGGEGPAVGADVQELHHAHAEQGAVLLGRDLHVVVLAATVGRVLERLRARLDPLHWALRAAPSAAAPGGSGGCAL